jgi:cobyrinic acid a,c-diamide synthase
MTARFVLAGTASSVGKTTLATGLIAAFRRRGLRVQAYKAGPDYIDPTYHTLAAGIPCRNLDSWLVPHDRIRACFAHVVSDADVAIIEGMMGLYDGLDYRDEAGSTAELAKLLGAPVIVVLDIVAQARSAAATALGFLRLDPEALVAGFLCNRVGSESHYRGVKAAIEDATGLPVLGGIPCVETATIPQRHLGLTPTDERGNLQGLVGILATLVEAHCDLDAILAIAHTGPSLPATPSPFSASTADPGPCPIIAVARDRAFSFYYEDNLDLLRLAGAEIVPFSPLDDRQLPEGTAGVYIGGGFPELYAAGLAANITMRASVRGAVSRGVPCYAECGGLMYLTSALVDTAGERHAMVGLLPGDATMRGKSPRLGYVTIDAMRDTLLLRAGETVRGHEFHYSVWGGIPAAAPHAYGVHTGPDALVRSEGYARGNLLASYIHLHFWSMPILAERFVTMCRVAAETTHPASHVGQ